MRSADAARRPPASARTGAVAGANSARSMHNAESLPACVRVVFRPTSRFGASASNEMERRSSMMKFLIPAVAVAALAGCAGYNDGMYATGTPVYTAGTTYYSTAPVYGRYYVAPAARVQRVAPYNDNARDGDGVPSWRARYP